MAAEFIEKLNKTREYLDYLERHYNFVHQAKNLVEAALKDQRCVYDDFVFLSITSALEEHDLSKLSADELVQYRQQFYPTELEARLGIDHEAFKKAWAHHLEHNDHHWQTWTKRLPGSPYYGEWACFQMICDWVAMSLERNEASPREYYRGSKIELPPWAHILVLKVCDHMEGIR